MPATCWYALASCNCNCNCICSLLASLELVIIFSSKLKGIPYLLQTAGLTLFSAELRCVLCGCNRGRCRILQVNELEWNSLNLSTSSLTNLEFPHCSSHLLSSVVDIDDVLDVTSLQGTPGVIGTLLAGCLATPESGNKYVHLAETFWHSFSAVRTQFARTRILLFVRQYFHY